VVLVREQTDGKPVIYLDYQAYEPMAIEVFRQIAGQIRQTWPDTNRVVITIAPVSYKSAKLAS